MDFSRMVLFCIGWLAYASIYLIRKPMSLIKADLDFDNEYSTLQLGLIDFAFTFPFALGQIFLGYLGDRRNGRQILFIALLMASLPLVLFFHYFNNFGFYFIMLMLLEYRNSILGLLTSASFIGGIAGTFVTVYMQYTYGWTYVYIIPGIVNVVIGVIALFFFKEASEQSPVIAANRYSALSPSLGSTWEMCSNRNIFLVSASIFVVRLVRFTMYMWVPYFLLDEILYAQLDSGLISIAFEGGGIFGSLFFGFLVDKFLCRRAVLCVLICNILTAVAIKFFHTYSYHIVHAILWLVIIGFFNCGADSLLSGTIATEIGESVGAPGSVIGFISGVGSLGAVLEGPLFSFLLMLGGWDTAFLLCILLSGAASTIPLLFYPGMLNYNSQVKVLDR